MLTSIENIHHFIDTATQPVFVHCSDFEDYICKHDRIKNRLFNEYLAASFLNIWEIPFPEWSFINVKEEHLTEEIRKNGIQPINFRTPCFGSKHLIHALEITRFFSPFISNPNSQRRIANPLDFLKIGLFDLWLANEDRNRNNANLLLNPTIGGDVIVPIDHSDIFNTRSLYEGRELAQLTSDDSILLAGYTHNVARLNKSDRRAAIDNLCKKFYLWVSSCHQELERIVNTAPQSWNLPLDEYLALINDHIMTNNDWLDATIDSFRNYTQIAYA